MTKRAADDELFTVAPEEFTAARKRLEKQLRDAGDAEGAARVKVMRKPPITVWAVNQLARRKPEEIAELVKVAGELRRAQAAALHGRESDFLELGRKQRSEVGRLVGIAGTLARQAGHATNASFARKLGATVQAAVTAGGELAERLVAGRLEEELTPEATFGAGGVKVAPSTPPRQREREREGERECERERERERKIAKLRKVAVAARAEATKRRFAAERAERAADAAEAALRDASR